MESTRKQRPALVAERLEAQDDKSRVGSWGSEQVVMVGSRGGYGKWGSAALSLGARNLVLLGGTSLEHTGDLGVRVLQGGVAVVLLPVGGQ